MSELTPLQERAICQLGKSQRQAWLMGGACVRVDRDGQVTPVYGNWPLNQSQTIEVGTYATRKAEMTIYRANPIGQNDPHALLIVGNDSYLFPWENLASLRHAIAAICAGVEKGHIGGWLWDIRATGNYQLITNTVSLILNKDQVLLLSKLIYADEISFFSQTDAANYTGLTRQTIANALHRGELFGLLENGRWSIPDAALDEWMKLT